MKTLYQLNKIEKEIAGGNQKSVGFEEIFNIDSDDTEEKVWFVFCLYETIKKWLDKLSKKERGKLELLLVSKDLEYRQCVIDEAEKMKEEDKKQELKQNIN